MRPRHIRVNRAFWDSTADEYQRKHGERLAQTAKAWGVWRIPEDEVRALGEVAEARVLELGCGAARWSQALASDGATAVGIDLSSAQLRHAREGGGPDVALLQASAEDLPFADGSFDVVFGDHGALSFADPRRAVPEAARVLVDGGRLAFSIHSPLLWMCWNPKTERVDRRLHFDYFDMRSDDDESSVQFQLPYGEWIDLFGRNGLRVERLLHLRPAEDATTTYDDYAPRSWARRWAAEDLWILRKGP